MDKGVAILQYTDDTIPYLGHDLQKALNLKLRVYAFAYVWSQDKFYGKWIIIS
jgi:hypothetical protein